MPVRENGRAQHLLRRETPHPVVGADAVTQIVSNQIRD